MIYDSVEAAIKNRWITLFAAFVCGGLGIWSYSQLKIDAYPDISGTSVQVVTSYTGRAAEEVEQEVTMPMERVLSSVPRVEILRSRTIFGLSLVQLNFEPGVDNYWARDVVFQKLGEVQLSPGAAASMSSLSTAYGEIYRYRLAGDSGRDPVELRTLNDWIVIPRLLRASGVAEVTNFGGLAKQYAVRLDRYKLQRYGVKLQEVASAIRSNNSSGGGSFMQRGSTSLVIRGLGRVGDIKELEKVFIKNSNGTPVTIGDVGTVTADHLPRTGIFGKDSINDEVEGIVRMRRGENPSTVLRNVQEAVLELNETRLPKGISIEPFYDRTLLIKTTLHTVLHNSVLGILLVVLTLFLFLGSPKPALIVALTIPGSLLFALVLMKFTGIPISLLSVGAIDFGIIVDGAIIMSENIMRRLSHRTREEQKQGVPAVILDASRQVLSPMLFSMLIIIIAYLPLLLLSHIEGLIFRPMAVTLCFTFLGALLLALYVIPVLSTFLFKAGTPPKENLLLEKLRSIYEHLLLLAIKSRWKVVGGACVLLGLTVFAVIPRLGTEFLPYMDEGVFWVRAGFPEGISIEETASYARELREIISQFEPVSFVTSQTGRNDTGTDPFPVNRTELMVGLKPRREWKRFSRKLDLEKAMRERLQTEFPTVRFNLTQPIIDSVTEDTNGTSADLAVELIGDDLAQLRTLAVRTVSILKDIRGSVAVGIEQEGPQPQLQIRVNRARLGFYQLSADSVNDVINTAIGGQPVSKIYEGERRFDIVVKYDPKYIDTPEEIGRLPVFNEQGEAVPLAQVTNISVIDGQTLIARANNRRRITVRCDIRGRAQGDFVAQAQELFKAGITLPPGYRVEWKGMFENLERARRHFSVLVPFTVALILAVLFLTFKSWTMAGLVLVTVPFALVGSMIALWLRGMHLSVSSGVGLTSLFGVTTMNGVLMVSYINQLFRSRGEETILHRDAALLKGAAMGFRPILMTAIVAMLGLLPASLATGIGSDIQRPIATVIIWGLFSSAVLTLFVLPVIYHILEEKGWISHG